MRTRIPLTILLLLVLFVFFFISYMNIYNKEKIAARNLSKYNSICGQYLQGNIKIGKNNLSVAIADDNCKTSLGLSGISELKEDEGMLFLFEKLGSHGFWMKNMKFPIDILWLDNNFKVVGMENNVSPDSYPKTFGKGYISMYVLEVPSGYSQKNNIKVGDQIIFNKK